MRVKGGVKSKRRHNKFLKMAKGYWRKHGNTIRKVRETLLHAGQYAYNGRKLKKRDYRSLWIVRINAAVKENGMQYNQFIKKLSDKKIALDRKMLAKIAVEHPKVFNSIVDQVK